MQRIKQLHSGILRANYIFMKELKQPSELFNNVKYILIAFIVLSTLWDY